jgi:hypothetical protein
MGTDFRETDLKITSDPRLRAGVRAALECICDRHGLSKAEQHELAAAVEKECGKELHDSQQSSCAVTIKESEDRIEVNVAPTNHATGAKSGASETNVASSSAPQKHHGGASHLQPNGRLGAIFVKRFHKNPAHS